MTIGSAFGLVYRPAAVALCVAAAAMGAPVGACAQGPTPANTTVEAVNQQMARAASAFLNSLSGQRRRLAQMEFTDSARMEWEYIPTYREGLALADMNAEQRTLTHRLLEAALSAQGYLKVNTVMHLDEILRQFDTSGFSRSGEGYMLAIFGDPNSGEPWGWRFEGHHVSLNFTSENQGRLSVTPLFLGSNPATVQGGIWTGLRALGDQEDLGRRLVQSLSSEQRSVAVIAADPPNEIVTRNDPVARELTREGLAASDMTGDQRNLLLALIGAYASTVEEAVAEERMEAIREAGIDEIRFAWAGSVVEGEPFYYRVHGPTTLIELDKVQDGGNHVHSVWRDLQDDFGGDALRRHYQADH